MSIGLLEDPDKIHEILDDLQVEAIYWTLLYSALHTCKHDGDFGLDILNHCRQEINKDGEETGRTLGGTFKRAALRGPLSLTRSVTFKCEPLQDLFSDLSEALENYYRAVEDLNRAYGRAARHPAGAAIAQEKLNEQRAAISAPSFWSGMFQTALNAPGWISDGDVVNTPDPGPMVG